jgi:hypothetical protein
LEFFDTNCVKYTHIIPIQTRPEVTDTYAPCILHDSTNIIRD